MNTLRRRVIKPNIDKYIYLFSECARTRTNGANVIEYSWNIDQVSINEKCTIELYQNTTVNVNKGTILDISYPFLDTSNTVKLFLEPQVLSTITLSINNSISGDTGIPATTVFVLCLKITEFEPKVIAYGGMDNVNVNQEGVSFSLL